MLGAAPVTALAFSPDGATLVSNGDRRLDLRSPKDAGLLRHVDCKLPRITSVAFAPRGDLLAVGGGEPGVGGEVRLIAWPDGKELHRLNDYADLVTGVAFDTDGGRLGVASSDRTVRVVAIAGKGSPSPVWTVAGHAGPVLAIAFSPSGGSVLTAGADRSLKAWSSSSGRLLRSFNHHTESIHALAFRPRGADATGPLVCATAGDDRTVRIWQPEIGRMVRIIRQHEGSILALAWQIDGTALFSAGREGVIRKLDGGSDTVQTVWRAHDDWIYALAISPDGATLASGDWAGQVRVHDVREGARVRRQEP